MAEMLLREHELTCNDFGPFTKNKEKILKSKKQEIQNTSIKNELDKTSFQHDMADGDFKDLPRITALINYYVTKHLILLKSKNMMNIKKVLLQ